MEVDATQYASMSLELLQSDSFFQFTDLGKPYLDKPPLLFWLSSMFIFIFGNTTFAYKIGSFIMAWASVYFIFKFVQLFYKLSIARLSALVYASSVGFILFTNDIRTDTLLISFVTLAVWQYAAYSLNYKTKHLVWGSIAVGIAMLSKGPLGLVIPAMAIVPHVLIKKNFKAVLTLKMLLIPIIILIVLSPMLYGLYQQFGIHGIRFYFWEQSFGRITGENVWENDASLFYFIHNILWAFVPFTLFLIAALFNAIFQFKNRNEYISFFGFVLPFIALSLSHYKLPHYIYSVIPFAAVLSSHFLLQWFHVKYVKSIELFIFIVQSILIGALLLTPYVLLYSFGGAYWISILVLSGQFTVLFLNKYISQSKHRLIITSLSTFLISAGILNSFAYPHLLKYQASTEAAFYINEHEIPKAKLCQYDIYERGFYYYIGDKISPCDLDKIEKSTVIFTNENGKKIIESQYNIENIKRLDDFNVTRLSLLFLNPETRATTLRNKHLIKIKSKNE